MWEEDIMKLLILTGAGAVGKMTVGQELMKITKLRLYHNHMDIEMVIEIFGNSKYNGEVGRRIREVVFEEFAKSDLYGLIFTYMWAFDHQSDWEYIDSLVDIFRRDGADIYYVELVAPQVVRLQRNITENRLQNKASKRNIEFSTKLLLNEDKNYRLVSNDGEIPFENYLRIDNSNLKPSDVAEMIKERFSL
ncbi:MAG: AAA family ATPase [Oscillospiraceae bacterium]|nr:AAA family ATPase [Oscillospiraceae bacterium]